MIFLQLCVLRLQWKNMLSCVWFLIFAAHGLGFWTDRSAVHEAAAQGRALQLQQLIEAGAAVNIVAVDSITPLHEACIQGQTQCVRLLLNAGAQVRWFQSSWWFNSSGHDWLNDISTIIIILNYGTVFPRWMLVTLMAALRCVMPVQLGALTVWSCCWSMERQLILHCLLSHLFMRPVWEVCRVCVLCVTGFDYTKFLSVCSKQCWGHKLYK